MITAVDVLNTIRYYLGVAESPPHSNLTIIGEKFARLDGADAGNGVPWCAETVSVCQREAGNAAFQVSASCSTLVARYQDGTNGTWLGNPGLAGLLPGDEFFLGSRGQDHTGLVESVDATAVITVEGNWGDRVARVTRPIGSFYGFGRPRYTATPSQGDPFMALTDQEQAELYHSVKAMHKTNWVDDAGYGDLEWFAQQMATALKPTNDLLAQIIRKVGA